MISQTLRKPLFISILGHAALFGIFTFSFGPRIPKINFTNVSFWGQILQDSELIRRHSFNNRPSEEAFIRKSNIGTQALENLQSPFLEGVYLKPQAPSLFSETKINPLSKLTQPTTIHKRREPVIIFHPQLPYHFLLYFKDREVVHIELIFSVMSAEGKNSIVIKRKISSGNLEADLLTMRYIGRYLFIQQQNLIPNTWQTVKIDLSTKND